MISTASVGMTRTMFVSMLSTSSTTPPRYPLTNPIAMPRTAATAAASAPTMKLDRSPYTNCA